MTSKTKEELICSACGQEIESCDSCGKNFSTGQNIKCTDRLEQEHECENCFEDSYSDAEVEKSDN